MKSLGVHGARWSTFSLYFPARRVSMGWTISQMLQSTNWVNAGRSQTKRPGWRSAAASVHATVAVFYPPPCTIKLSCHVRVFAHPEIRHEGSEHAVLVSDTYRLPVRLCQIFGPGGGLVPPKTYDPQDIARPSKTVSATTASPSSTIRPGELQRTPTFSRHRGTSGICRVGGFRRPSGTAGIPMCPDEPRVIHRFRDCPEPRWKPFSMALCPAGARRAEARGRSVGSGAFVPLACARAVDRVCLHGLTWPMSVISTRDASVLIRAGSGSQVTCKQI